MTEATSNMALVKLYRLKANGEWEDQGTGRCSYVTGKDNDPDQILFLSKDDESVLHRFKVLKDRKYDKQEGTMIVWTEDDDQELALSFMDEESCEAIWCRISTHTKESDSSVVMDQTSLQDDAIAFDSDDDDFPQSDDAIELDVLPVPALSNLQEIASILNGAKALQEKDQLATYIVREEYIYKLFSVFETCEDLENTEDLHTLYTIMIAIILLNENTIIENIVSDDNVAGVMGMLEYHSKSPNVKTNHREFLNKHTNVEQIVPMENVSVMAKIRETFRLQYLKNVVLRNYRDDTLMSIFDSLIQFNHVDIITGVQSDVKFLKEVFAIVKEKETTQRKDAIRFVQHLCTLARSAQQQLRSRFYKYLAPLGLFDVFELSLIDENPVMRSAGIAALSAIVDSDMALVWNHVLEQMCGRTEGELIKTLLECFVNDADPDLKSQYFEILKVLLEPSGRSPIELAEEQRRFAPPDPSEDANKLSPDVEDFRTHFYDKYGALLLEPAKELEDKPIKLDGPIEVLELSANQSSLHLYILEILCLAVREHGFRSKYLILSSDCCRKMVQLYRCRESHIKLAVLRLFRTCVNTADEFYIRHLRQCNVFEATIRILLDTDGRDNLLNSACLELLEFVQKENIKSLISHLISDYGSVLDTLTYTQTCKQLRQKYEQNTKKSDPTEMIEEPEKTSIKSWEGNGQGSWNSSTMDDDEESYFNGPEDDEEEEHASTIGPSIEASDGMAETLSSKDDTEDELEEDSTPRPPPPLRKRKLEEDDEDDVLAIKQAQKASRTPTPLIIKSQPKRLRSSSE